MLTRTELDAITALAWLGIAVLAGLALHAVIGWLLTRWAERSKNPFAAAIVRRTKRPAAYIFPLLAILVVLPNLVLPQAWTRPALHAAGLLVIAAMAWTAIALIRLWGDVIVARHRIDVEDNLLARQLGTRVDILSRVGVTMVIIVAIGTMLMTFPSIRALGTTVLASAGLAGIVVGLAARPLFENLVAGIQLALTQPMRIDDVVVVQNQFGRIEEIHTTYVVLRLWDLRRMVVPLSYFINTPFENWTRRTANLIGEVYLFADYAVDVEALRAELPRDPRALAAVGPPVQKRAGDRRDGEERADSRARQRARLGRAVRPALLHARGADPLPAGQPAGRAAARPHLAARRDAAGFGPAPVRPDAVATPRPSKPPP